MSSAFSLPNHTFTGQAYTSKRLTSIVRILSPETDLVDDILQSLFFYFQKNIRLDISHTFICQADDSHEMSEYSEAIFLWKIKYTIKNKNTIV